MLSSKNCLYTYYIWYSFMDKIFVIISNTDNWISIIQSLDLIKKNKKNHVMTINSGMCLLSR